MPAPSPSPIDPVLGHLADLVGDAADDSPGLLSVLASVADLRHRRGAARAGGDLGAGCMRGTDRARSFVAIAKWAADADEETLARLGVTSIAVALRYHARRPAPAPANDHEVLTHSAKALGGRRCQSALR
jgi:hypothetical protein